MQTKVESPCVSVRPGIQLNPAVARQLLLRKHGAVAAMLTWKEPAAEQNSNM
jgi:hypothetical protein